jgi:transcriptional regulator with XRE-family HTH domain
MLISMDEHSPPRGRGRPPKITGERRYPNRLRALRQLRGLSQQAVAGSAGISVAYYGALERGDKRINADTAELLSDALGSAVGDLWGKGRGASVPVIYTVAAAEPGVPQAAYDLPEPRERVEPHRLAHTENCFAAAIIDDSANVDFAPGTILIARRIAPFSSISVGAKVVARFFFDTAAAEVEARATHEILYGVLDRNIVGDLVMITRTRNPLVPRHLLVQGAPIAPLDRVLRPPVLGRDALIDYVPRPGDPGELLGVAIYAMGPV